MMRTIDSNKFIMVIKQNKNIDFLLTVIDPLCKEKMIDVIRALVEGVPSWEDTYVYRDDDEALGDRNFNRMVLQRDVLRDKMSTTPHKSIDFGKDLDLAGAIKLIQYRFTKGNTFFDNRDTKNAFYDLCETIRQELRNDTHHSGSEDISQQSIIDRLNAVISGIESIINNNRKPANNGDQVLEVLQKLLNDLNDYNELYLLSTNQQPINKDSDEHYSAEYLYGFDMVFFAYPSCQNRNMWEFYSNYRMIAARGKSNLVMDEGTQGYLNDLLQSKDKEQAARAQEIVKNLKNDNIPGIALDTSDAMHYTDSFIAALRDRKEHICVISDNTSLQDAILEMPENIVGVIVDDDRKHISTYKKRKLYFFYPEKEPEEKETTSVTQDELRGIDANNKQTYNVEPDQEREIEEHKDFENSVKPIENAEEIKEETHTAFSGTFEESVQSKPSIRIPGEGATVFFGNPDEEVTYRLGKRIGTGGEGSVYNTYLGDECVKVFSEDRLSEERISKIREMVKDPKGFGKDANICWPREIISEPSGRHMPIGYSMLKVNDAISLEELIYRLRGEKDYQNRWNRIKLIQVCKNILLKLNILHENEVLVGDINPKNILVNDNAEVFFIDTDSYQYKNYLCKVGTPEYSSPRLWEHNCNYSGTKRNIQDERFAVARLLFHILFLGESPFYSSSSDNTALKYCITKKRYRFYRNNWDRRTNYIYGNLSDAIKEAFMTVFYGVIVGGDPSSYPPGEDHPEKYPDDQTWIARLQEMESLIFTEKNKNGILSNELIPTDYIEDPKTEKWEQVVCPSCKKEYYRAHNVTDVYCPQCRDIRDRNRAVILRVRCKTCGKVFTMNKWDMIKRDHVEDTLDVECPDCNSEIHIPKSKEIEEKGMKDLLEIIYRNYQNSRNGDL